jgi:phytoene synthase
MDGNYEQCRLLVRTASRDRYLATLFAPANHRDALFALYAFDSDLASIRERAKEPMPGEIRLQWWREVLQGQRGGEAAAHPVAAALLDTIARYAMAAEPFLTLIDARGFDLYDDPIKSIVDLEDYATKSTGVIIGVAAHVLAGRRLEGETAIRHTGFALQVRDVLLAFPQTSARGQMLIPGDILGHFGAKAEDAFSRRMTPEWRAALAEIRIRARRHLDLVRDESAAIPPSMMPALLPAALIRPTLSLMERKTYDPFHPSDVAPWRRQWLLWRAARDPVRIYA